MKKNTNLKFIKILAGIILIFLGIIGLFLPLIPGTVLIIFGIIFLTNKEFIDYLKKSARKNKKIILITLRYIILLILAVSLFLFYKVLTPLTVYSTAYFLKLFYSVSILKDLIIVNSKTFIQIIPACVAGSAYLFLLILNLLTPMKPKQRIYSILFSISLLFIINLLRIITLSFFVIHDSQFFDFTHKLFWYLLSTVFIVGIWLLTIKLFKIKNIPAHTDIKYLIKNIKK